MTRQETLNIITDRMHKTENSEKYHNYILHPEKQDDLLHFHVERAIRSLEVIQAGADETGLYELDFSVSIREAQKIMDEQGWE